MIRQSSFENSELIKLLQLARQSEIKERQELLKEFLVNVKEMIQDQALIHLKNFNKSKQLIYTQPQVFISYAWEDKQSKLTHLHNFLKQLNDDLTAAGLTSWWDKQCMTGNMDQQMCAGIQNSQYMLLIGTNYYAERLQSNESGVSKELNFALEKAKKKPDFLLPLLFEGERKTTFSTLNNFLVRDCSS